MAETERNLLDVRNEIVERQYREMKEAYERYRLLYTMKSICYYPIFDSWEMKKRL